MRYPFTASAENISLLFDGKMHGIPKAHPAYRELYEHLKQPAHDYDLIADLLNTKEMLARLTSGAVTVVGNSVFHAGVPIRNAITEKLLDLLEEGFDAQPWAHFLDKLMVNPSQRSRECLFGYLEKSQAPITDDGCFIAFKLVRDDFTDVRTGTFDNSPGKTVQMPRDEVDADPNVSCSSGLHVCGLGYFSSGFGGSSRRILCVKVHPADVVAVPYDYDNAKMRVCRFEVVSEVDQATTTPQKIAAQPYHETNAPKIPDALNAFPPSTSIDLEMLPEYHDATSFSQDWQTKQGMEPVEGAFVMMAPAGWNLDIQDVITPELPDNDFAIGSVESCTAGYNSYGSLQASGWWVDVLWECGTQSENLFFNTDTIENAEVTVIMPRTEEIFRNAIHPLEYQEWFGDDEDDQPSDDGFDEVWDIFEDEEPFDEDEELWGDTDVYREQNDGDDIPDVEDVYRAPEPDAFLNDGTIIEFKTSRANTDLDKGIVYGEDGYEFPLTGGETLTSEQVIMYGAIYGKEQAARQFRVPLEQYEHWCELASDYLKNVKGE